MERTVKQFIEDYASGKFNSKDTDTMIAAGWYDWFCEDEELKERLDELFPKVAEIANSKKIDVDNTYVFFKNNCPMCGDLYDDFRFCDVKTGDVLYTVIPATGHTKNQGRAELWGNENDFERPLTLGTWETIQYYFGVE
jgi:hypothetical protein